MANLGRVATRGSGSLETIFTTKYTHNHWGSPESVSGAGSEMRQTGAIRSALPRILEQYGVNSMLDIPCGDFNWMRHVDGLARIKYIGADIVAPLVAENVQKYGRTGIEFVQLDLTRDIIPRVDLVFNRDCLVHLGNQDVLHALQQIKVSGSIYLLSTSYPAETENIDTHDGRWRPINLQQPPFNLPQPIEFIETDFTNGGTQHPANGMGLWRISDI